MVRHRTPTLVDWRILRGIHNHSPTVLMFSRQQDTIEAIEKLTRQVGKVHDVWLPLLPQLALNELWGRLAEQTSTTKSKCTTTTAPARPVLRNDGSFQNLNPRVAKAYVLECHSYHIIHTTKEKKPMVYTVAPAPFPILAHHPNKETQRIMSSRHPVQLNRDRSKLTPVSTETLTPKVRASRSEIVLVHLECVSTQ